MRLILEAGDLSAGLVLATSAMPAGKKLVRLIARESGAVVIGADQAMTIEIELPATVETAGEIVLNAERITGIAGHASGNMILSATDTSVGITTGEGKYRLPILPNPPAALVLDNEDASITISASDLRHLLEPVAAAGNESSRFYLRGICLLSEADCLSSTATDGTRLLRTTIQAPEFTTDRRPIIPSKSVAAIGKLSRRDTGMVTLRRNSRLFSITGSGYTATTKLIDFTYPDLTSVLPAATDNAAIIDRKDFADSLARLMAAMDGEAPLLCLEWHWPGPVLLYLAKQPENSDLIKATTEGDVQIAVAPAPLAMLLDELGNEQLRLEATNRLAIRTNTKLGVVASSPWNFEPRTASGAGRARPGKGAGKDHANAHVGGIND